MPCNSSQHLQLPELEYQAILTHPPLLDFSDAGNWLFSGRKWIDPADPDGRAMLDLHHHNLSLLFPAFAAACSRDRLADAVADVIARWSHRPRAATPGECELEPAWADSPHRRDASDAVRDWHGPCEASSPGGPASAF